MSSLKPYGNTEGILTESSHECDVFFQESTESLFTGGNLSIWEGIYQSFILNGKLFLCISTLLSTFQEKKLYKMLKN